MLSSTGEVMQRLLQVRWLSSLCQEVSEHFEIRRDLASRLNWLGILAEQRLVDFKTPRKISQGLVRVVWQAALSQYLSEFIKTDAHVAARLGRVGIGLQQGFADDQRAGVVLPRLLPVPRLTAFHQQISESVETDGHVTSGPCRFWIGLPRRFAGFQGANVMLQCLLRISRSRTSRPDIAQFDQDGGMIESGLLQIGMILHDRFLDDEGARIVPIRLLSIVRLATLHSCRIRQFQGCDRTCGMN